METGAPPSKALLSELKQVKQRMVALTGDLDQLIHDVEILLHEDPKVIWFTTQQAAILIGIDYKTYVNRLAKAKPDKYLKKVGKQWRVHRNHVLQMRQEASK
jgi:uncharacterized short protein YbdD (DUF466 family)